MINKNIIGSVSPLKARKSKGKAGKVGMKATATRAQDKSGFSRSGVVPSGKGYMSNLESLTAGTRLTSSLADALGRSGTGKAITGKNDFGKIDEFGEVGEVGIETKEIPGKKEGAGNRFYDACHDANGDRLPVGSIGTTTWIDDDGVEQSKSFKCEWDPEHVSTGAHNYVTKQEDGKTMDRNYKVVNNKREYEVNENTDSEGWYERK